MTDQQHDLLADLTALEQLKGRQARPCRFAQILNNSVTGDTKIVLKRLVEETAIPIQQIRRSLMSSNITVGWATLRQHRDQLCTCFIGGFPESDGQS
jgi:hypothetical protein